jgi:hypothetical protein
MADCKSFPVRHAAGGMKIPACFALMSPTATSLGMLSRLFHYFSVNFRTLTPISHKSSRGIVGKEHCACDSETFTTALLRARRLRRARLFFWALDTVVLRGLI